MSDAIVYCDICSKIILPSDIEGGNAFVTSGNSAVCANRTTE